MGKALEVLNEMLKEIDGKLYDARIEADYVKTPHAQIFLNIQITELTKQKEKLERLKFILKGGGE